MRKRPTQRLTVLQGKIQTQNDDESRYAAGTFFHQGMIDGISDIRGNIRFIPKAGRKKKQTTEEGADLNAEDMEESVEDTEASYNVFQSMVPRNIQMNLLMKRPLMT